MLHRPLPLADIGDASVMELHAVHHHIVYVAEEMVCSAGQLSLQTVEGDIVLIEMQAEASSIVIRTVFFICGLDLGL